jgi:hypothetical protein
MAAEPSTVIMKTSDARNMLGRPWWNLCFVHGDQTKYYRQLYGKRRPIRTLQQQTGYSSSALPEEVVKEAAKKSQQKCQCGEPDGNSTLQRQQ